MELEEKMGENEANIAAASRQLAKLTDAHATFSGKLVCEKFMPVRRSDNEMNAVGIQTCVGSLFKISRSAVRANDRFLWSRVDRRTNGWYSVFGSRQHAIYAL